MPSIVPDMGVDYDTLARLSTPNGAEGVVAGGNPAGNIGTTSQAFELGRDKYRQNQFIQQATSLAALQAQIKATQAGEYQAGAPGRMADIQTDNALSQGRAGDLPTLLSTQAQKFQNENTGAGIQAAQQSVAQLGNYLNSWDGATDDEKKTILEQMKDDPKAKFGKIDIGSLPLDKADTLMKALRKAQVNTPDYKKAELNSWTKLGVAGINAQGRRDWATINSQGRLDVQKLKDANPNMTTDQLIASLAKKGMKEGLAPGEEDMMNALMREKAIGSLTRGAAIKPNVTIKDGKVTTEAPDLPEPPTVPDSARKPAGAPPTDTGKITNVDLKKGVVTIDGKDLKIVAQKKDVAGRTQYRLEDGSVITSK